MTEKKVKILIVVAVTILLLAGVILYILFDSQGMNKGNTINFVNYNVNDYVEVTPVVYNNYGDVYASINVSKVHIKNIDTAITKDFISKEEEIIGYIDGYYDEISTNYGISPVNTVVSSIKSQINGAVLSIFYRLDFNLDETLFEDNVKTYIITTNIDLRTNKVLTNADLLLKYDYNKNFIADKLFIEEILIGKGQVVIDKNTNISLTRSDIERKKDSYINRIILDFDNTIDMYIESNNLVLVYDKKELKNNFFDNEFETDIVFKYLK